MINPGQHLITNSTKKSISKEFPLLRVKRVFLFLQKSKISSCCDAYVRLTDRCGHLTFPRVTTGFCETWEDIFISYSLSCPHSTLINCAHLNSNAKRSGQIFVSRRVVMNHVSKHTLELQGKIHFNTFQMPFVWENIYDDALTTPYLWQIAISLANSPILRTPNIAERQQGQMHNCSFMPTMTDIIDHNKPWSFKCDGLTYLVKCFRRSDWEITSELLRGLYADHEIHIWA